MEEITTPSIVTKQTIQFADYEKLDIRLGLIMTCERIEGTDSTSPSTQLIKIK